MEEFALCSGRWRPEAIAKPASDPLVILSLPQGEFAMVPPKGFQILSAGHVCFRLGEKLKVSARSVSNLLTRDICASEVEL